MDYSKIPANYINKAYWTALKNSGLIDEKDYYVESFEKYVVPIIPAQQVPEFNNLLPGKFYIFYDYETKPSLENWWVTEESLYLNLLSINYDQLNAIMNFTFDYFRRYQKSVGDLESDMGTDNPFKFYYFKVDAILSPEAFKNEGALRMGQIEISYSYSRDIDSENGRFI